MNIEREFPKLAAIEVVVEERMVALEITTGNWRTEVFNNISAVPTSLPAIFDKDSGGHGLELLNLVREAYGKGRQEARFEMPYTADVKRAKRTVLRTVTIKMQYEKKIGLTAMPRARLGFVSMPMLSTALWSSYELQIVERDLAATFPGLSASVIHLAVTLSKLDVAPAAGRAKLHREARRLLEKKSHVIGVN